MIETLIAVYAGFVLANITVNTFWNYLDRREAEKNLDRFYDLLDREDAFAWDFEDEVIAEKSKRAAKKTTTAKKTTAKKK